MENYTRSVSSYITVNIYEGSGHGLEDPPGEGDSIFRIEALTDIKEFIELVVE